MVKSMGTGLTDKVAPLNLFLKGFNQSGLHNLAPAASMGEGRVS